MKFTQRSQFPSFCRFAFSHLRFERPPGFAPLLRHLRFLTFSASVAESLFFQHGRIPNPSDPSCKKTWVFLFYSNTHVFSCAFNNFHCFFNVFSVQISHFLFGNFFKLLPGNFTNFGFIRFARSLFYASCFF